MSFGIWFRTSADPLTVECSFFQLQRLKVQEVVIGKCNQCLIGCI